ncbi:hypothetical protein EVAR_38054_1 [Eumeta japonica]|uniref:Uncharacterized protein n=1 Tax=Eumeta variegata TaxID=151549 RepID=A0A4C1W8R0_EUMVA|nr:hypothetical protein EVAR_38054_1 [Eumeta japonica]
MENGRVGVARSTVDMHRVRVRNRASVGATVARRAYSPAPICACVSTRQGYSAQRSYSATGLSGERRTSCNGDFGYRRVSPHPGLPLSSRAHFSLWSADFLQWRRSNDGQRFQTSLLSRALQGDGWLATVSDAPLPLHFIGGASVAMSCIHFNWEAWPCT